jgi:hypothetical protein
LHKEKLTFGAEQVSQDSLEAFYQVPTFIYSYKRGTNNLHRTSLVTGKRSSHRGLSYTFKYGCCWSEVAGGSLVITGGGFPVAVREVVRIDTCREFAVTTVLLCSHLEDPMLQFV